MRRLALLLTLLLSPALLCASEFSDLYVIPVAGHVTGLNGNTWMSDVAIQNFQSTPLTVQIVVIESGEGMAENVTPGGSVTIPANGTRILRDVLNGHRSGDTIGAIMAGADRPFAISSRAYISNAAGATQGQSVTPLRNFLDTSLAHADLSIATAYVAGLTSNSHYRTNLGFVAGSASPSGMTLEVTLRNASGVAIGTRTFTIPGNGFEHVQFSSSQLSNQSFDEGSATFRIVSGDGSVAPYASIIDNLSSGGFFIGSQFAPNAPFASGATTFRILFDQMRNTR
jgi:hypothetical protein